MARTSQVYHTIFLGVYEYSRNGREPNGRFLVPSGCRMPSPRGAVAPSSETVSCARGPAVQSCLECVAKEVAKRPQLPPAHPYAPQPVREQYSVLAGRYGLEPRDGHLHHQAAPVYP